MNLDPLDASDAAAEALVAAAGKADGFPPLS